MKQEPFYIDSWKKETKSDRQKQKGTKPNQQSSEILRNHIVMWSTQGHVVIKKKEMLLSYSSLRGRCRRKAEENRARGHSRCESNYYETFKMALHPLRAACALMCVPNALGMKLWWFNFSATHKCGLIESEWAIITARANVTR